jgi:hypothetical protein
MIRVLSRLPERSMFGLERGSQQRRQNGNVGDRRQGKRQASYFSIDVAKLVTQPLCKPMLSVSNSLLAAPREICIQTYVALEGALEYELLSHYGQ